MSRETPAEPRDGERPPAAAPPAPGVPAPAGASPLAPGAQGVPVTPAAATAPEPAPTAPEHVSGRVSETGTGTEPAQAAPEPAQVVAVPVAQAPATGGIGAADSPSEGHAGEPEAVAGAAVGAGDRVVERKVPLLNVANLLTMLRVVLVPVFAVLLAGGGGHDPKWRAFAWAAFGVAMITDLFDGELARRHDLVTDFGKIVDPIADKAIMGTALLGLSALGDLPWWVTGVILARELGITLMRFWVIKLGVIPASRGGKLKTLTQGVAVGMYILTLTGPLASLRAWLMAIAVVLTVVSGIEYVAQAARLRRAARRERGPAVTARGGAGGAGGAPGGGAGARA